MYLQRDLRASEDLVLSMGKAVPVQQVSAGGGGAQ